MTDKPGSRHNHADPIESLAEIYSKAPKELAAWAGITPLQALRQRIHAAARALPYLYSKPPREK